MGASTACIIHGRGPLGARGGERSGEERGEGRGKRIGRIIGEERNEERKGLGEAGRRGGEGRDGRKREVERREPGGALGESKGPAGRSGGQSQEPPCGGRGPRGLEPSGAGAPLCPMRVPLNPGPAHQVWAREAPLLRGREGR